ncbi:hypothetical protein [Bacillus sp. CGMCC 1.16541]|uniref:capsular polysaccharide export protein, LipB/KpsS family n=1 Tax=Bacillus sp. CGMCC 1.16541 TaxID=2185143 RepID=UPI000D72B457|nr:hypothetical protein [Bacillus sp. CGMCC 1.16541]
MFGENEVNNYHVLKYSLLQDFFSCFSGIEAFGIPFAPSLTVQFLNHIQPFVDENLNDLLLIRRLRKKKDFKTMGDINRKLVEFDHITPVVLKKDPSSILMASEYLPFAEDQLKEYNVTLYGSKRNDSTKLKQYIFKEEIVKSKNQHILKEQESLKKQIVQQLKRLSNHYYFKEDSFQQWLLKVDISVVKWVYIIKELVVNTKPSIIIVPSEASQYGAILGLIASKYQIPFVNMPLLTIADHILIPSRATHYFVWGDHQKSWLLQRGVKENHIFLTGNVKFSYDSTVATQSKELFLKEFNLSETDYLVGFTSQSFIDTNDQIEHWILSLPADLSIKVIIKKHPNDPYDYFQARRQKNIVVLPDDYPLFSFLHHIDGLMTISSTTAFEAALLKKPLFILQPSIPYHYKLCHNSNHTFFATNQAGGIISNKDEFVESMRKLSSGSTYELSIKQRTAQFLKKNLLNTKKTPSVVKRCIQKIISENKQ